MVVFAIVNHPGMPFFFWNYLIKLFHSPATNRDTFIYAASIETSALDTAIKVLGEVILRPQLTPQEVSVMAVKFNEIKS